VISTYCYYGTPGSEGCFGYTDITAAQKSSADMTCTSTGGTVESACPTANEAGCCSIPGDPPLDECYYCPTSVTSDQTLCTSMTGTWTTGPTTCP
jgi:hypothetical protein